MWVPLKVWVKFIRKYLLDSYSRVANEKLYTDKTALTAADMLNDRVLPWYQELSYKSIAAHVEEIYDHKVLAAEISAITDSLLPVINEWRNRPLQSVYPIVFMG